MCNGPGSKDTKSGAASSDRFHGYTAQQVKGLNSTSLGRTVFGDSNTQAQSRSFVKAAETKGNALGGEAQLGAKTTPAATANLMTARPVEQPTLSSVFGVTGFNTIKETEDAFGVGTFGRGQISVPDSYGWDFAKGQPFGETPSWSPNRGQGAVRDAAAAAAGTPYDREVTPERARSMLSKGQGTLSTWTEGLSEGNYQYDEEDKPAVDKLGMAYDMMSPMVSLITGNIPGALYGGAGATDTLQDYTALKMAGVFGPPSTGRNPSSYKGSMPGNGGDKASNKLTASPSPQGTATDETEKQLASTQPRPRMGKSTLNKTGPQGITDEASIFKPGLSGTRQKRSPILMTKFPIWK